MDNKDLLIEHLQKENDDLRVELQNLKEENSKLRLENDRLRKHVTTKLVETGNQLFSMIGYKQIDINDIIKQ